MTSENSPTGINNKYCCEDLRMVVELDEASLFSNEEEPSAGYGALEDFRNLSVCPFCGAAIGS
jgi:hypothetical protein